MTSPLTLRSTLEAAARHPWRARTLAAAIVIAAAVAIGVVMPRGPMTSTDSVAGLLLLAAVGAVVGC